VKRDRMGGDVVGAHRREGSEGQRVSGVDSNLRGLVCPRKYGEVVERVTGGTTGGGVDVYTVRLQVL
jgi:hypothetical protein